MIDSGVSWMTMYQHLSSPHFQNSCLSVMNFIIRLSPAAKPAGLQPSKVTPRGFRLYSKSFEITPTANMIFNFHFSLPKNTRISDWKKYKKEEREKVCRVPTRKREWSLADPPPPPELPGHVTYDPSPETKIVRLMWVTYGWTSKNK